MCPDKETLSAFFDDEVEDRFRSGIEKHLSSCENCRLTLDKFRGLRTNTGLQIYNIEEIRTTLWEKICYSLDRKKPLRFWERKVSLPLPAAAAAAALFIFITAFSLFSMLYTSEMEAAGYSGLSVKDSVPISGEDDFRYFQHDQIFNVDLNLPENTFFIISGTPQLIKEAEYINRNTR